jgi:thiol-disulfide isomerase/thioredoxin
MKTKMLLVGAAIVLLGLTSGWSRAEKALVGRLMPALKVDFIGPKPTLIGQPRIIEFWATWCGPCRQTIPHLNEIYRKYKDKGLVVVGISDEDENTIKDFRKKVPMDYAVAIDRNGKLSQELAITEIPYAVLVEKSGRVVWEGYAMMLTDADIKKILN